MAWLPGYTYRRDGSVNATVDGAQTDYQKKLLVGESSGASGEEVDCENHCQDFPNDIRFTGADEISKHSYWVESITGVTPNRLATIWIEVATIPASGDVDLYMYYGKSGDSGESDFDDTFVFGELWDNATIDPVKWPVITSGSTYTIDTINHFLEWQNISSGPAWQINVFASKAISFPTQFIVEDAYGTGAIVMSMNQDDSDNIFYHNFVLSDSTVANAGLTARHMIVDAHAGSYEEYLYAQIDGSHGGAGTHYANYGYSGWVSFGIRMWQLSSNLYIEEGGIVRRSGTYTGGLDYVRLEGGRYSTYPFGVHRYGAFKIRKDSSPEPTWGTWGGEEGGGKTRSYAFIIG